MLKNRSVVLHGFLSLLVIFNLVTIQSHANSNDYCRPDTSLTFEKYEAFLNGLKDETRYRVVPLNRFRQTLDSTKIIVGLRHDVDNNLQRSVDMAKVEFRLGLPASYYFLHTSSYYYSNPNDVNSRIKSIDNTLLKFQNDWKHEVGFHSDLVTLQLIHKIDPVDFLHKELKLLRDAGLKIYGSAAHGSPYCKTYHYINYYFFEEYSLLPFRHFINTSAVLLGNDVIKFKKGRLNDFDLDYEAYFLDNNKYYSDAQFVDGRRWNFDKTDWHTLKPGDRVIFLIHPEHWSKVNTKAEFSDFRLPGQTQSSVIDEFLRTIQISYPNHKPMNLNPEFRLKDTVSDVFLQTQNIFSGFTEVDFSKEVEFVVKTRNGKTTKKWKVSILFTPSNEAEVISVSAKKNVRVHLDASNRTIHIQSDKKRPRDFQISYALSPGASALVENIPVKSKTLRVQNNQDPSILSVIAEDGKTRNDWLICTNSELNETK